MLADRGPIRSPRALIPGFFAMVVIAAALGGCSDDNNNPVVVRDLVPPAAPQALYSVTGDGQVSLYWVKNTDADLAGYRVYRGPAYAGPYTPLATTVTTTYVDQGLTNGTTFFYAVAAYDAAGNESELSVENVNDTPRPAGAGVVLVPTSAEPGSPAGFDFSAALRRLSGDAATDIFFEVTGNTRLMVARDLGTDVQDAGLHVLDDLDWSPTVDGWSPTGTVELILGHSYYAATRDNHYAKFRVTSLSNTAVTIDWAYQIDPDNPQLSRPHRTEVSMLAGEKRPAGE